MKKKLFLMPLLLTTVFANAQNVGIGTSSPQSKLHIVNGASGATPFAFSPLVVENNNHTYMNLLSPAINETAILFGQPGSAANGVLMYNNVSTPNGFQFRNNGNLTRMAIINNGNVGIGTISPLARMHVVDSSVLFSAAGDIPVSPGNLPISGEGRRMMWYADKAAFRAGYTDGTHWDNSNVGGYSVAMGYSTTASGFTSTALGNFTTASEYGATAMGYGTNASGMASTAMGLATTAKAVTSLSIGYFNDDTDNPDPYNASPSDRIFQIGNGDGTTRSNAITVLRNGYTGIGTISPDAMLDVTRGLVTLGTATAQFRGTQHSSNFNYSLFENTYIRAGKDNGNVILNDIPGGRVGIGTATPGTTLHVLSGVSGYAGGNFSGITAEGNGNIYFNLLVPNSNETGVLFGKASDAASGGIVYNSAANLNGLQFRTDGNSTKMVLTQNGNVGLGILSPNAPLAFANTTGAKISLFESSPNSQYGFAVQGSQLQVYSDNPAAKITFGYYINGVYNERMYLTNSTGILTVNGTNYTSDARLKRDITPLQNSLQKIIQLGGYHYFWKNQTNGNNLQTGVLAQEVQKLFPELVTENKDGMLAVNYTGLIPVVIESIKEQQRQIDELKKMVEKLVKQ